MSNFEEHTVTALKNLFEKVETLGHMDIREMLEPDKYYLYEDTLQFGSTVQQAAPIARPYCLLGQ